MEVKGALVIARPVAGGVYRIPLVARALWDVELSAKGIFITLKQRIGAEQPIHVMFISKEPVFNEECENIGFAAKCLLGENVVHLVYRASASQLEGAALFEVPIFVELG